MIDILTRLVHDKVGNSLTKYPSIPTYNKLQNGKLTPLVENYEELKELYITEKIDGTNIRIVTCGNDYIIGSREEWIYAKGDRVIPSNTRNFINFLIPIAERITNRYHVDDTVIVIYGELYGSKIQHWKNYTSLNNEYGFRVFDIYSLSVEDLSNMLDIMNPQSASCWRDNNNQPWYKVETLTAFTNGLGLLTVPYFKKDFMKEIGDDLDKPYQYLQSYTNTSAALHDNENNKAEGIVVRTFDRDYIAKLRFEDYMKIMRSK